MFLYKYNNNCLPLLKTAVFQGFSCATSIRRRTDEHIRWCALVPFLRAKSKRLHPGTQILSLIPVRGGGNKGQMPHICPPGVLPPLGLNIDKRIADFSQPWRGIRQGRRNRTLLCIFMLWVNWKSEFMGVETSLISRGELMISARPSCARKLLRLFCKENEVKGNYLLWYRVNLWVSQTMLIHNQEPALLVSYFFCSFGEFAKVIEKQVWRARVAHLHPCGACTFKPESVCSIVNKSWQRFVSLCFVLRFYNNFSSTPKGYFSDSRGLSRRDKLKREERDLSRLPTSFLSRMPLRFLNNQWRFCHVRHNPENRFEFERERERLLNLSASSNFKWTNQS